tara:strand:+ start:185 stop:415 length:231 start_codon:yes stop_codon:yes gene_type:complete
MRVSMPMEMAVMGQMRSFILGFSLFFLDGWTNGHYLFDTQKREHSDTNNKRQLSQYSLLKAASPESDRHENLSLKT